MILSKAMILSKQKQRFFLSRLLILILLISSSISFTITTSTKRVSCGHIGEKISPFGRYQVRFAKRENANLRMTMKGNTENNETNTAIETAATTATQSTTTTVSKKLQQALRLKEQANAAREKAQQMEKTYAEEKIQSLEAKLQEAKTATARKRTNSSLSITSMSPSDEQTLQEKIDNLKNFLNNNGTRTAIEAARASFITQEKEKGINTNNTEMVPFEDFADLNEMASVLEQLIEFNNSSLMSLMFEDAEDILKQIKTGNLTSEEKEDLMEVQGKVTKALSLVNIESNNLTLALNELGLNDVFSRTEETGFPSRFPSLMETELNYEVNETDVKQFVDNIMVKITDEFQMNGRPRKIIGSNNYFIAGKPVGDGMKDGNILLSRIDKEVENLIQTSSSKSSDNSSAVADVIGNLQYYYVRDADVLKELGEGIDDSFAAMIVPSEVDIDSPMEFIQAMIVNSENLEPTGLLITHKDTKQFISSNDNNDNIYNDFGLVDNFISILAILGTANFAASCYEKNIFYGFTSPILWGLIALISVKQFGHLVAAAINKLEVSLLPRFIPSLDIGLIAARNQIKSPAKNNKQIFDYASSGPLLGITASWIMLIYGLLQTAQIVKPEEIAALPHVPLQFLKLSTLTSSTIQTFLGTDVLLSLDPTADSGTVAVHPLVLAAHLGLLVNGLSLFPVSTTSDGERMIQSAFSRTAFSGSLIGVFLFLFLIAQGVHEFGISTFILSYYFLFQGEPNDIRLYDFPARNDVDPAGSTRQLLYGIYMTLGIVVLYPSF